ncbi:MAG: LLM class F420-dependent oxidoreductase [Microthrixaceae bacterium]|jgi:F420-dependent oxidoreductase-like protein|nr:LLM class F420-dependent oxidoreductase [Actinomycetota bacterium]HMS12740.1 LLM class F420-dependent oxidoreductase [Microthrixaceae bacterium]HMT25238.1 LLM class F420-dependent oxidoreductase [Microthrixaceae bacterium]
MKLSMQMPYAGGFEQSVQQVIALEKAGLDIVYVAEAYSFDAVSAMGYIAAKTSTVEIASGILPIYTRTPSLMAMTAAGLDFVSNGRFILGIGASGPQVIEGFHGVPYDAPLGRTREIIDICRKMWKREEKLTHDGKYYTLPLPAGQGTGLGKALKLINHPVRADIPVHIASLGPKNLELTAELANGWLPIFYWPERAADVFGPSLEAGFAKRDPELGPMDVVAGGMVAIGDDVKGILDFARPLVALYVGGMGAKGRNFYNALMRRYGYEAEAEQIQDLYLAGQKKEAEALVPTEFLDAINLVGPEGYVRERLEAFQAAGVTVLNVTPVGADPAAIVEQVKGWTA